MFEPVSQQFESAAGVRRYLRPGAISAGLHLAAILFLATSGPILVRIPEQPPPRDYRRSATVLVAPSAQLTQREPNRKEVSKEFNLDSLRARPSPSQLPRPGSVQSLPGQTTKFKAPAATRAPAPGIAVPEAPNLDLSQLKTPSGPPPGLGSDTPVPPPKIEAVEKPKLAFERPGTDTPNPSAVGRVPVPKPGLNEAMKGIAHAGSGKQVVGDQDEMNLGGAPTPGLPRSPAPGKLGSSLELLSDPQGVDFKAYLIRVLSAVRRNWYAVIPESARLGRSGRVSIQFSISKDGSVPKLVIASPSGAEALDRAAVAGISASNPFPPLPPEFTGSVIRLQLVFIYSLAR